MLEKQKSNRRQPLRCGQMYQWPWAFDCLICGRHTRDLMCMPPKPETVNVGFCKACGQMLTDPESIARGYGPVCLQWIEKPKS